MVIILIVLCYYYSFKVCRSDVIEIREVLYLNGVNHT